MKFKTARNLFFLSDVFSVEVAISVVVDISLSSINDGDFQSDRLSLANNSSACASRFFVHFVTARLRCDRKCLISRFVGLILYGEKTCM